jgi:hypothetical protein
MKRFRLLLIAFAMVSFTAFYACGGGEEAADDATTTEDVVTDEPQAEPEVAPVADTTAVAPEADTTEAPEAEKTEGE